MRILLVTIGSHGDVHPFVGVGMTLRARGHDVTVATNEHFESMVRAAGLNFRQLGDDAHFREMMEHPDLWHTRRAFKFIFERAVVPLIEETYRVVEEAHFAGPVKVVASSLSYGARIAQDKFGVPLATAHLAPAVIRTVHDVPKLPGLMMPAFFPLWLKRKIWEGGDRYVIDPIVAPPINALRQRLGLPLVTRVFDGWWNSPQRIIGMWPEWYGELQPDRPAQLRLSGFPLFDESEQKPIDPALLDRIKSGAPPVAFTAGSAMRHGKSFFTESAAACERLNCRGLLLTRFNDQAPAELPSNVQRVEYAPFGQLFPLCAAVVHHGGIGTTAQCLRAGVPQLVMPMAHDQLDNAHRIKRLGAGLSISRGAYRGGRVARLLDRLIHAPGFKHAALVLSRRFDGIDSLSAAADLIETF